MQFIVGDSSSLILLVKSKLIYYLLENIKIIIPNEVYLEILKGKLKNKEDAYIIEKLVDNKNILIKDPIEREINFVKEISNLHVGELCAIALSKQLKLPILIDDKKGINTCILLNIEYIPSLSLLEKLYKLNIINNKQTIDSFNIIIKNGFFKKEIIKKYMEIFKEA
jgi:predicted nucleic acid-binding protein